ncbi:hypothetical protein Mgra_00003997 [Meloidogyne graminicola]|uniref:VTT domain-containing protein n=1 Tax=Meloidogyne graminicola TaxID=189291 RepID=A0A8S9ZSH2_9BILA|nr:hypothetical protein Mgra_00003997 [Meloidogyne graminicola]
MTITRLFFLPAIFTGATLFLWLLIYNAPEWPQTTTETSKTTDKNEILINIEGIDNNEEKYKEKTEENSTFPSTSSFVLELPTQFENFTTFTARFRLYEKRHSAYIITLFTCIYLYKQTFAIPGSFLMNIIAGAIYGLPIGFLLCSVLTTIGSTLCYLFSELFSREYVLYYFGEKINYLQRKVGENIKKVDDNSHRLLAFLLFARMFPISPSWLLNIVAPFLNIPLPLFIFSVLVGLAPYNFICVQAGFILSDLRGWDDVFSTATMLKLSSFALLPLCYAIFTRKGKLQHKSLKHIKCSLPQLSKKHKLFTFSTTNTIVDIERTEIFSSNDHMQ